jgi:hypothetical protein
MAGDEQRLTTSFNVEVDKIDNGKVTKLYDQMPPTRAGTCLPMSTITANWCCVASTADLIGADYVNAALTCVNTNDVSNGSFVIGTTCNIRKPNKTSNYVVIGPMGKSIIVYLSCETK